jgi:hypothetical protein
MLFISHQPCFFENRHCLFGDSISSISVRAGTSTAGSGGTIIPAVSVAVHPKYNSYKTDYDVGIIKV